LIDNENRTTTTIIYNFLKKSSIPIGQNRIYFIITNPLLTL